jgi:DNA-binding CsgD family transcriptional regulator
LLTPREREILQLLAEEEPASGYLLEHQRHTAETHRGNILQKLNLHVQRNWFFAPSEGNNFLGKRALFI